MIRKYLEKWRVPGFRNPKPVVAVLRLSGVIGNVGGPVRRGLTAAALVRSWTTAQQALFRTGELTAGERLVVVGGNGAVGLAVEALVRMAQ